jgi:DNA modification methylase
LCPSFFTFYMENGIYLGDCMELLQQLDDNSVDLFLIDPPYGTTANKWDKMPDFAALWPIWKQKAKPNAAFAFTGMQPFTSYLIMSNLKDFKYELIWEKSISTGFLNSNKQPLRNHENILVFYNKQCTYNPQKTQGEPIKKVKSGSNTSNYGEFGAYIYKNETGERMPKSVLFFPPDYDRFNGNGTLHQTQKPINLFRYLIRAYSNPGDLVVDCYSGSGTTVCAAHMEGRNYLGFENDQEYFEKSIFRLDNLKSAPTLF